MNKYICKQCKHKDTDQIGDIVCQNKKCPNYGKFIEEEFTELKTCKEFEINILGGNKNEY